MIEVKLKSTSMRISPLWGNFLDRRYDDNIQEVPRIKIALRSHSIDNVKTVCTPYYHKYWLSRADLLSHRFGHIFPGASSFRRLSQFNAKPILITRDNRVKFVRFHDFS
jgi:hypothetical protein